MDSEKCEQRHLRLLQYAQGESEGGRQMYDRLNSTVKKKECERARSVS